MRRPLKRSAGVVTLFCFGTLATAPRGAAAQSPPPESAPQQAYPQQPYPPQAYPPQAYPPQPYPQQPYPQQPYPPEGYPQQPYPQQPYPYPQQPYPPQAYPPYPPQPYPNYEQQPPPPSLPPLKVVGYKSKPHWELFGAGLGLWAGWWIYPMIYGAYLGEYKLLIPVVGPLLYVSGGNPLADYISGLLILDAIGQAAGLTLAIVGVAWQRKVPILGTTAMTPTSGPTGLGIGLAGSFEGL
jgi:hypothetical protein